MKAKDRDFQSHARNWAAALRRATRCFVKIGELRFVYKYMPFGDVKVAFEQWPFIVSFPIENGEFPWLCLFTRG